MHRPSLMRSIPLHGGDGLEAAFWAQHLSHHWRLRSCATRAMTSIESFPTCAYIDATELGAMLGVSMRTVVLRAKHRPWLLPPRAELFDRELLRWRQDAIALWLQETQNLGLKEGRSA